MRVIKWEPFRDFDDVFDRFFHEAFRRLPRQCAESGQPAPTVWAPATDISETDTEYLVKAELPEVRKEDLNVTVHEGVLTLTGERKQEKRTDSERVHRIERCYGSFARRFTLPEDADEQGIRAESKDGVVLIHIPKHKVVQPQPRQISVD